MYSSGSGTAVLWYSLEFYWMAERERTWSFNDLYTGNFINSCNMRRKTCWRAKKNNISVVGIYIIERKFWTQPDGTGLNNWSGLDWTGTHWIGLEWKGKSKCSDFRLRYCYTAKRHLLSVHMKICNGSYVQICHGSVVNCDRSVMFVYRYCKYTHQLCLFIIQTCHFCAHLHRSVTSICWLLIWFIKNYSANSIVSSSMYAWSIKYSC